jgi:hypothetical protein
MQMLHMLGESRISHDPKDQSADAAWHLVGRVAKVVVLGLAFSGEQAESADAETILPRCMPVALHSV